MNAVARCLYSDTDQARGLTRFGSDPADATACVSCGASCLPPEGGLSVLCGDCAVRIGNTFEAVRKLRTGELNDLRKPGGDGHG